MIKRNRQFIKGILILLEPLLFLIPIILILEGLQQVILANRQLVQEMSKMSYSIDTTGSQYIYIGIILFISVWFIWLYKSLVIGLNMIISHFKSRDKTLQ